MTDHEFALTGVFEWIDRVSNVPGIAWRKTRSCFTPDRKIIVAVMTRLLGAVVFLGLSFLFSGVVHNGLALVSKAFGILALYGAVLHIEKQFQDEFVEISKKIIKPKSEAT